MSGHDRVVVAGNEIVSDRAVHLTAVDRNGAVLDFGWVRVVGCEAALVPWAARGGGGGSQRITLKLETANAPAAGL